MTIKLPPSYKPGVDDFTRELINDPSVEVLTNINPWVYFYYRRADWVDGRFMGTFSYGWIYLNKKGRFSLVGAAEDDWTNWAG